MLQKAVWWVRLLAAQRPINRPGGRKETLLYFRCWQLGGRLADVCAKASSPQHHHKLGGKSFYGQKWGGGYMPSQHGQL